MLPGRPGRRRGAVLWRLLSLSVAVVLLAVLLARTASPLVCDAAAAGGGSDCVAAAAAAATAAAADASPAPCPSCAAPPPAAPSCPAPPPPPPPAAAAPSCPAPPPPPPPAAAALAPDALAAARRAFAVEWLRNATTQCGRTYFDVLPPGSAVLEDVPLEQCPDIESSIQRVVRPTRAPDAAPAAFLPVAFPGCRLKWYTQQEACATIARQGHLVLIGDSLVRHISNALLSILSGNYKYGMVRNAQETASVWGECACDGAYGSGSGCHGLPAMAPEWTDAAGAPPSALGLCPEWRTNRLHFWGSYGSSDGGYPDALMESLLANAAPADAAGEGGLATIYVANGIGYIPERDDPVQDRIDTRQAWRFQWSKSLGYATKYARTRLIAGTVLAHHGTFPCQTPEGLAAYNDWVREVVVANNSDLGVELFDGAPIMRHVYSRDNVHYLSHENVLLAQLLLNYVDKPPKRRRTRPAAVDRSPPAKGRLWRDGPQTTMYDQEGVHPAMKWWVGPQYELRGCRCFPDWARRQAANASAPVCHCRGWCPPSVTPEYLTHYTGGCGGVRLDVPLPTHQCSAVCGRDGPGKPPRWQAEQCSTAGGCGHPEPPGRCRDCAPPPPAGG
jgi:hypothetical protein